MRPFRLFLKRFNGCLHRAATKRSFQYQGEQRVIEAARSQGKGVLIKKALASGHAVGGGQHDQASRSLSHVLEIEGVSSVIVGTINPGHLMANAQTAAAVTGL